MRVLLLSVLAFFFLTLPAFAADEIDNTTHLPIPRFASLRSNEVNMRTGPGFRYPIKWIYKKRGLPVEITAEFDIWRRVRDPEGTEGWISSVELSGKRSAFVTGGVRDLRYRRDDRSEIVAHLEPGAIGQLLSCKGDWCKANFGDTKGFLRKAFFWGAYADEAFD